MHLAAHIFAKTRPLDCTSICTATTSTCSAARMSMTSGGLIRGWVTIATSAGHDDPVSDRRGGSAQNAWISLTSTHPLLTLRGTHLKILFSRGKWRLGRRGRSLPMRRDRGGRPKPPTGPAGWPRSRGFKFYSKCDKMRYFLLQSAVTV